MALVYNFCTFTIVVMKVGYEDVHPSFIAISWEGMDYDSPLRDRTRVCKEFIDFIVTLR